jgi:hypothetical protein
MAGLTISVDEDGGGTFRIDNQPVPDLSHSGDYFRDVPVTITGIPSSGYDFLYWDYSEGQNHMRIRDQSLIIKPAGNIRLVAHFTIHEETDLQVMINEINYHSDKDHDPGDWVEIYNPKEEFTEMEGWVLKDRNDDHVYTFSKGQQIGPKGFLVVCEDLTAFGNIFPAVGNRTGELGFGLSNGGELIRLYDQNMVLVDSVRYEDSAPWPAEADGKGPTLELTDPATDNYLPGNWHASKIYGTPGAPNGTGQTLDYVLHQNFPNPFTSNTIISYTVHQPGYVVIKISNIYGKEMLLLSNGYKEAANYLVSWNVYNIPSGIYFCTMIVDNNIIDTKKLVVTR